MLEEGRNQLTVNLVFFLLFVEYEKEINHHLLHSLLVSYKRFLMYSEVVPFIPRIHSLWFFIGKSRKNDEKEFRRLLFTTVGKCLHPIEEKSIK
jgi:hypothetical protein